CSVTTAVASSIVLTTLLRCSESYFASRRLRGIDRNLGGLDHQPHPGADGQAELLHGTARHLCDQRHGSIDAHTNAISLQVDSFHLAPPYVARSPVRPRSIE